MPPCTTPPPTGPITSGYTFAASIFLGIKYSGIANLLYGQLISTTAQNYMGPILNNFYEIGGGNYYLHALVPYNFRGGMKIMYCGEVLLFREINPEEYENLDVKISSRSGGVGISSPSLFNPFPLNPKDPIELRITDDYLIEEVRSINITSIEWPNLIGSSTTFIIDCLPNFVKTAELINFNSLRIQLTNLELIAIGAGRWNYEYRTVLSNSHKVTLTVGNIIIVPPFSD